MIMTDVDQSSFETIARAFCESLSKFLDRGSVIVHGKQLFDILRSLAATGKENTKYPAGALFLQSICALQLLTLHCTETPDGFHRWVSNLDPLVKRILKDFAEYQKSLPEGSAGKKIASLEMLKEWDRNVLEHSPEEDINEEIM